MKACKFAISSPSVFHYFEMPRRTMQADIDALSPLYIRNLFSKQGAQKLTRSILEVHVALTVSRLPYIKTTATIKNNFSKKYTQESR